MYVIRGLPKTSELHIELKNVKSNVIPLQARCGPEFGYRYSSTLP